MSKTIKIKRVYEAPAANDGTRILVDRLWPRGIAKDKAKVDLWLKDIAPSDALQDVPLHVSHDRPFFRCRSSHARSATALFRRSSRVA